MRLDIHLSPSVEWGREGVKEGEAETPALLRCYVACDPSIRLLLSSDGALLVGAPAPSWVLSCFKGQIECTVVCAEVCVYYMGRGGGKGGVSVRVNVAEVWARSQEQGAPCGMAWKNETEECRLHRAV